MKDGREKLALAQLDNAGALDTMQMSEMQFGSIQASRIAFLR
jgi:hypothetical protein